MVTEINSALESPADFTAAFTERVSKVSAQLELLCDTHVVHSKDMNYANGQSLRFYFGSDGLFVSSDRAVYTLDIYISSKGNLFTFRALKLVGENAWCLMPSSDLPRECGKKLELIHAKMRSDGYVFVAEDELETQVPGEHTEMDGAPATLFNVLFSEMV